MQYAHVTERVYIEVGERNGEYVSDKHFIPTKLHKRTLKNSRTLGT